MPNALNRLMPWVSLAIVVPLALWAMSSSEEIADAAYLLLFIPLLWACMTVQPIGIILMAALLTFIRLILQYIRSLGMGLTPTWTQLFAAGISPGLLYVILAIAFIALRYRLQQLRRRLMGKARWEGMGQLAGGLAYDLQNILGVIAGHAQAMQESPSLPKPLPEPLRDNLDAIADASQRGVSLAQQFMGLQMDGHSMLHPIDLNLVVDNSYRHVKPAVGERVELDIRPAEGPLLVRLNDMQINQVILNLCMNASDALSEHGRVIIRTERRRVEVEQAQPHRVPAGDYAVLSVCDSGHGMSARTVAHIFDPFYSTKSPESGAGLGLAVVRDVVQQHGGFIEVESKLNKGSTFSVFLPLCG